MSSTSKPEAAVRGGESFPASARILKRPDFLRVQGTGRRVHTPSFVIMVLPSQRQRVGITITRRTANAVGRNRVRRLVREVFRRNRDLFPEACDVVFVARNSARALDYDSVKREVSAARAALSRAAETSSSAPHAPTRALPPSERHA